MQFVQAKYYNVCAMHHEYHHRVEMYRFDIHWM